MRKRTLPLALALAALSCALVSFAGCGTKKAGPAGSGTVVDPNGSGLLMPAEGADAGPTRKADKVGAAGERIKIPAGPLVDGSTPGDEGRDPLLEPVLLPVELGPFEIDKLPYPNDPTKPARTGVSRDEARGLCQKEGARLCTELEWERACKGNDADLYAAGNAWDPACARDPNACASSFGVLAMGGALREWTDSELAVPDKEERRRAVARGAAASADGVDHRCAHRIAIDATAKGNDLGFRCCKGPPNAAAIPPPKSGDVQFGKTTLDIKRVQKLLAAVPQLAHYSKDVVFFNEEEAIKMVLAKGDGGVKPGPALTTSPVLWTPVPTEEVVVMALRAKTASLIVAFYKLPEDKFRLASSLVLKDELGPVVLSYTSFNKKRVSWSTCWDCPGEQGAVEHKDGKRIVVVHY